jgi:hypothetical protein
MKLMLDGSKLCPSRIPSLPAQLHNLTTGCAAHHAC